MNLNYKNGNIGVGLMIEYGMAILLVFGLAVAAFGQTNAVVQDDAMPPQTQETAEAKTVLQPVLTDYKGVKIGMSDDEVKGKLGKPKIEDKDGVFYVFSKEEQAQIMFDADKKVRVISISYNGGNDAALKYSDVFGANAAVVTKEDGSVYNLVTYPEAGFWVAYYRSAGEDATVSVTVQKL